MTSWRRRAIVLPGTGAVLAALAAAVGGGEAPGATRALFGSTTRDNNQRRRVLFVRPERLIQDLAQVKLLDDFVGAMTAHLGVSRGRLLGTFNQTKVLIRKTIPVEDWEARPGGRDAVRAAYIRAWAQKLNVPPGTLGEALRATLREFFLQALDRLVAAGRMTATRREWFLQRFDLSARRIAGLLSLDGSG